MLVIVSTLTKASFELIYIELEKLNVLTFSLKCYIGKLFNVYKSTSWRLFAFNVEAGRHDYKVVNTQSEPGLPNRTYITEDNLLNTLCISIFPPVKWV